VPDQRGWIGVVEDPERTVQKGTSRVKDTHRRPWLSVIVGGESLVSHAGGVLLWLAANFPDNAAASWSPTATGYSRMSRTS
jgi:hypothetical protein